MFAWRSTRLAAYKGIALKKPMPRKIFWLSSDRRNISIIVHLPTHCCTVDKVRKYVHHVTYKSDKSVRSVFTFQLHLYQPCLGHTRRKIVKGEMYNFGYVINSSFSCSIHTYSRSRSWPLTHSILFQRRASVTRIYLRVSLSCDASASDASMRHRRNCESRPAAVGRVGWLERQRADRLWTGEFQLGPSTAAAARSTK